MTQAARAFLRRVEQILDDKVLPNLRGLVRLERISSVSGGAGSRPEATGSGDEAIKVLEPYGYASTPPGSAIAVAFAPGTDSENRVALGVSSTAGRPSTAAGDTATWTAAGHVILLDDDGGLTITAKDGQVIDLDATGAVTISAGTAASITINVDVGQSVNVGGVPAFPLVKDAENTAAITAALAAGAAFVGALGDPAGTNASLAFAAAAAAYAGSPTAATTKAKGV